MGWIPFKADGVKLCGDKIRYYSNTFKFWKSKEIDGNVRSGSFSQDSKGNWFVNLVIKDCDRGRIKTGRNVGIDLGLKTIATTSDGLELNRVNLTNKYKSKLAMAQRANKKRLVKTIHTKIKNSRKDWNHKTSIALVKEYDFIAVGNVSSSKLKKTKMAKSVSDAGWSGFKRMLEYKAISLGSEFIEVNESFSTVTCSSCSQLTGPSGLSGLGVREWICSGCNANHNRDVNAAMNILISAQDIVRQREPIAKVIGDVKYGLIFTQQLF